MGQKIVKDSVRFILFEEIYQRLIEPKNKRKALVLIETAIQCFDRCGLDGATLKMIAREASVSAPLLKHYFGDLKEIREVALRYIRAVAQKIVVDQIGDETRPAHLLKLYFQAHGTWSKNFKTHARVWLSFLATAAKYPKVRKFNTAAVGAGCERLAQILDLGRASGALKPNVLDSATTAHMIQTFMLGWLVALITEDIEDADRFSQTILDQCLELAGRKRTEL